MSDSRLVIISDHLVQKIDKYRGQLSRSSFVGECVQGLLRDLESELETELPTARQELPGVRTTPASKEYLTKEDFEQFKWKIDQLQQEFIDFFIKYEKQMAGESLSKEAIEAFNDELKRLLQL